MKTLLVITVAIATALADDIPAAEVSSQFHSQDQLGHYSYGYNNRLSSKAETKSPDGATRGHYSYVDPHGKLQSVEYSADSVHGFRVAATNLPEGHPQPVQDPREVAEAKAAIQELGNRHLEHSEAAGTAPGPAASSSVVYYHLPVQTRFFYGVNVPAYYFTPTTFYGIPISQHHEGQEVVAARTEHLKPADDGKENIGGQQS